MSKSFLLLLVALIFTGCSRQGIHGTYQSVGSEDQFRITLEVRSGGRATMTTRSNLGSSELDKAVQSTMSIPDGKWTNEAGKLVVVGALADGKPATFRFVALPNGDLVWEKNGARLAKNR